MTPQTNFMVLAAIDPARERKLRELLEPMNEAPGRVNPKNTLIPFRNFETLHFARLLILEDKTLNDVRAYGGVPAPKYPLYLAFLGDIDGGEDEFFDDLTRRAEIGLNSIFSCCVGFSAEIDLVGWMKQHRAPAIANYVNWRGRTVRRVHEESALRTAIDGYIQREFAALKNIAPRELHRKVVAFVESEKSVGRLTLSAELPTPLRWRIENLLHLIGVALLFLLLTPLLILLAPFLLVALRRREKNDRELCWRVNQKHSDDLSRQEDHGVTNQFSAMGSLKPGLFRRWIVIGVLSVVNYGARHIFTRGRLARIRTIHFARWVFLDRRKRLVFFSNYDGTVESYMDDFINKTGFGLNAVFSNGIGYPRTDWLVFGGCAEEQKYKNFLRRHTLPTQVWYKAYPGLSAIDLERNGRIREGLERASPSEEEARAWAALL